MLEIEGVQYGKCAVCMSWYPTDEMSWDDEVLSWVCCEPDCTSFLVV
jgi:hypothetical protein